MSDNTALTITTSPVADTSGSPYTATLCEHCLSPGNDFAVTNKKTEKQRAPAVRWNIEDTQRLINVCSEVLKDPKFIVGKRKKNLNSAGWKKAVKVYFHEYVSKSQIPEDTPVGPFKTRWKNVCKLYSSYKYCESHANVASERGSTKLPMENWFQYYDRLKDEGQDLPDSIEKKAVQADKVAPYVELLRPLLVDTIVAAGTHAHDTTTNGNDEHPSHSNKKMKLAVVDNKGKDGDGECYPDRTTDGNSEHLVNSNQVVMLVDDKAEKGQEGGGNSCPDSSTNGNGEQLLNGFQTVDDDGEPDPEPDEETTPAPLATRERHLTTRINRKRPSPSETQKGLLKAGIEKMRCAADQRFTLMVKNHKEMMESQQDRKRKWEELINLKKESQKRTQQRAEQCQKRAQQRAEQTADFRKNLLEILARFAQ